MNYKQINSELATALGRGVVKLHPTKNGYKLRFSSDNPNAAQVAVAQHIVEQHSRTVWGKPAKVKR